MTNVRRSMAAFALGLILTAPWAGAEEAVPQAAAPPTASAVYEFPSTAWHLYGGFGLGAADGKYGDVLQKPLQFELRIAKQSASGKWRFGAGLQFGSMDPAEDANIPPDIAELWLAPDKEWARLETSIHVTRVFNPDASFRPYIQGRLGIERIHPRSELFFVQPPPEDLEPGDSPTNAANGIGFTLQPGFELALGKTLSLDVGAFATYYKTGEYDMSPLGLPPVDSGFEWGGRLGLAWRPYSATPRDATRKPMLIDINTGKPLPLPPPEGNRDPWGVPRSWGWATAEMLAINFGASMFNEYVRDANFNQISPRSFWANLEEGFTYDDNEFKTNQLVHPMNGGMYFNSARANGIDFWGSSAMAIVGAFIWECCGETHPMSYNDLISTGIGGMARGEVMYRISSLILDNTKKGKGRVAQEVAAALVDLPRGFNRVLSGDAGEVKGNPVHPYDYRPKFQLFVRAGGRAIGEGESISENTNTYGFVETTINYGDAWDADNRRPYDRFDFTTQSNFGEKTRVGRMLIRGDLWSKLISENHSFALQQDFDYIDNEAFEYGGQSLGPALISRFELSETTQLLGPHPGLLHPAGRGELGPVLPGRRREPGAAPRVRLRARAGRLDRALPRAQELPAHRRPLSGQLHRRLQRVDLQQRHRRHRAQYDPRRPAGAAQAGGADLQAPRDRGGRLGVLPAQPLRLLGQRRAARDRRRRPDDHPAQPGGPGVPDLQLQPLRGQRRAPSGREQLPRLHRQA